MAERQHICPVCGLDFHNGVDLATHKTFDHSLRENKAVAVVKPATDKEPRRPGLMVMGPGKVERLN